MLVVIDNIRSFQFGLTSTVEPLAYTGDIVVAMDPSKSNFAMLIGTPDKREIVHVEFSGNNRKRGPAEDTTVYCEELKLFLKQYLANCCLHVAGIEAAITPHAKKGSSNYAFHVSNMVLTEIRAAILSYFLEEFGIHIMEVNNWSWKHRELPEGYRGQDTKYSRKYLCDTDPGNPLTQYFEADMCDAHFIYLFLCDTECSGYTIICNQSEQALHKFDYVVTEAGSAYTLDVQEMPYNDVFTVEDNIN